MTAQEWQKLGNGEARRLCHASARSHLTIPGVAATAAQNPASPPPDGLAAVGNSARLCPPEFGIYGVGRV
jgi:hypothetical protein